MEIFALVAAMMGVMLLVGATQRPRLAMIVAAALWLAYAYWEYQVATGVLCDADCNIRVDLVLFLPILIIATVHAYRAYGRPPGPPTLAGMLLAVLGLIVLAVLAGAFGYNALAAVAGVGALAIGAYAVKSKFMTNRP